jgi:hypothetical protein
VPSPAASFSLICPQTKRKGNKERI